MTDEPAMFCLTWRAQLLSRHRMLDVEVLKSLL